MSLGTIDWEEANRKAAEEADRKAALTPAQRQAEDDAFWKNYYAPRESAWDLSFSRNPLYTSLVAGTALLAVAMTGGAIAGVGAAGGAGATAGTAAGGSAGAASGAAASTAAASTSAAATAVSSTSTLGSLWSGAKTILPVAASAYGIVSSEQQKNREQKTYEQMRGVIDTELLKFPGMEQDINRMYGQRLGILGQQQGSSIYEILQKHNASEAKSGFSGSGALESQLQFETTSVYDLFAGKGFELLSQKQSQLSDLEAQARGLRVQRAGLA